jgi:hypothetical protein
MEICFTIGGVRHCYFIPIFVWPIHFPKPGPGPVNFPELFVDASLIASIHQAAGNISDRKVRGELLRGVEAAVAALRERAGEHVAIEMKGAA